MNWISLKHVYYIPSEDFMSMLALLHLSSLTLTGFGVLRHSKGINEIRVHIWSLYLAAVLFILSLVFSRRQREEKDEAYMSTSSTYSRLLKFIMPFLLLISIASLITFAAFHGVIIVLAIHLTLITFVLTGFPRLLLCILTIAGIFIGTGFQVILVGFLYGKSGSRKRIVDLSADFRYGTATQTRVVFLDILLLLLQVIGGCIFYSNHWKLGYLISRYKARPAYFISNIVGVTEIEHALMTKYGCGFEDSINYSECMSNLSPRVIKTKEEQPSHAAQAPSIDHDSECLSNLNQGLVKAKENASLVNNRKESYNWSTRSFTRGSDGTLFSQSTGFSDKGTSYDYSTSIDGYIPSCPDEEEDEEWVKICNENISTNKRLAKRTGTADAIKPSGSFAKMGNFAYIDARFQTPRRERSATMYESRLGSGISYGESLDAILSRKHNSRNSTKPFTSFLFSRDAFGSGSISRSFEPSLVSGDSLDATPMELSSIDYSDNLQLTIKGMSSIGATRIAQGDEIDTSTGFRPQTRAMRIIKQGRRNSIEIPVPPIEYKVEHSSKHASEFPCDEDAETSKRAHSTSITPEKRTNTHMDTILSKYSDYRMLSMPPEGLFHSESLSRELEEMNQDMTALRDLEMSVTNPFLKLVYLLLPKCIKDALDVCGGKYEKLKGKREIMEKSRWPEDLLVPSRNTFDMFHSPSIEAMYVHWMDSFNAYFYGITKKETFSICVYTLVASIILCLRHILTMDNDDAATFTSGYKIGLLIARYILQAIVDLLCMIPIFRTSWKVHNKSNMRRTYFVMLFLCLFQYLLNIFDLCMCIGLNNPGYAMYNTVIMSLLLTKTSALLILRLPTYIFLYLLYFSTFLIIHKTHVKHKIYRWLLMEVFSQFIIGAGTYCFCARPIDTNRRLLFSMYILPYITYLNKRFKGQVLGHAESRGYAFEQGENYEGSIGGLARGDHEVSIRHEDKGSINDGRGFFEYLGSIEESGPTKLPMASI
ncbi:hypothetical protein BEWA_004000 [Theileria equi strain WA]|uniref:Uncharacterized protein n=1 Tax=Theileria equi strain WA TaxID=1537102 RepID=L0AZH5_THEEQ|nr:hypothetical protein BEWA_004000 [Theileria equi strain WA]AFZ80992.1 hypothetical protein BEWA_004000 [Theileria equi strain WA]|eukprot:XP_004830658.1 hypothetical protein BEWA_004000 [Theileria equi strain WA]